MKPIVGVMPLWDEKKDSIWMLPGYLEGIRQAGGIPVIFPLSADRSELKRLVDLCHGILLTGGHDVSPDYYHEKAMEEIVETCRERDEMEKLVLKMAMEADLPVLGICRGIQFINVFLGGSLYQDLPAQHPSEIQHQQRAPYHQPVHDVQIPTDTPLYDLLGTERLHVNSFHHQAIKTLAPDLKVMAEAPDGIVEAVYMPQKRFVWAVQWHPEYSLETDENSKKIFRVFIDAIC